MTVDELVATFAAINDRATLIALLAPLPLPPGLSGPDTARVTAALIAGASRCWRGRVSGWAGKRRGDAIAVLKEGKMPRYQPAARMRFVEENGDVVLYVEIQGQG